MKLYLAVFLAVTLVTLGQKGNSNERIKEIILKIPEKQTRSVNGIADYITANFTAESDKAEALYTWIAHHIEYDIQGMELAGSYEKRTELLNRVLKTRKGICSHYAELFTEIAGLMDITSFVVAGYTKQDSMVNPLSHVWNAVRLDSVWYLVDATWGAGYIIDNRFVQKFDSRYFKMDPQTAIETHMPFDPLWQFLSSPLTPGEFCRHQISTEEKPYFDYGDTLASYLEMSSLNRFLSAAKRVERNGIYNTMIAAHLKDLGRGADYHQKWQDVDLYNEAVNEYNEGISRLNRFMDYREDHFQPEKPDEEIRDMLYICEVHFDKAKKNLESIKTSDRDLRVSVGELDKEINRVKVKWNNHKSFLDHYLGTDKSLRKSLL